MRYRIEYIDSSVGCIHSNYLQISFEHEKLALRTSLANYDRTVKKIKMTDINVKETARMTTSLLDFATVSSLQ